MRIVSGKFKGRRITPPKNLPVRPTTDLSKEALFNILNHQFSFRELNVLDLFAGTGNISYEFASRGAEPITCVDGDLGCVNFIKKTAKEFDMDITAIKSDVFKFLERSKMKYDIIFTDPPYDFTQEQFDTIQKLIFANDLLQPDGLLIIEHSQYTKMEHLEHFTNSRKYGGSIFSFFEYEQEESDDDDDDDFDIEDDYNNEEE
ncbi:RsmD family RNA methyltransferase [Flavobacterium sp. xlx-214]|uniref:RsmD family RNA methyltransferase n=1 Tax=unclassified Flavobacterium TaxID=196869 RepID=UPI0013D5C720|nr:MULTISPECIES: RsmD family RNA methyltransferase [unclassified Flavobacterium]MBA5791304.1 RsmD family RNA methyltransferase [Flavobacterium sp. xlx-221]QMI83538.1 RsmD family RNA methyltransferase [Flavobacterium sp. xlx-214]